jgi:hypothetical protein
MGEISTPRYTHNNAYLDTLVSLAKMPASLALQELFHLENIAFAAETWMFEGKLTSDAVATTYITSKEVSAKNDDGAFDRPTAALTTELLSCQM